MMVYITYDMAEGKEEECQEYLANRLAPGLAKLGFQFADVMYKMWGDSPHILAGGEVKNIKQARAIFLSPEWEKLANGMKALTKDFKVRLVNQNQQTTSS